MNEPTAYTGISSNAAFDNKNWLIDKSYIKKILNEEKEKIISDLSKDPAFANLEQKNPIREHCKMIFLSIMDSDNFQMDLECRCNVCTWKLTGKLLPPDTTSIHTKLCIITKDRKVEVCNYRMGKYKFSLLHIAVAIENTGILEKYLEKFHCDLNINQLSGKNGISAMHIAAQGNYPEGIDLLLQYNAKIDVPDKNNLTPLHHAAFCKNARATTHLINKGAALNSYIHQNLTTLAFVLRNTPSAKKAIVELLDECITLDDDDSLRDKTYVYYNFKKWKMRASEDQAQSLHAYDLLYIFAKEEQSYECDSDLDLIEHPLVQKMLEEAWTRNMLIAYWAVFIFKFLFLLIIAIYVCNGRNPPWLCVCLFCFALVDCFRNMIAVLSFTVSPTATKLYQTIGTYYLTSFQFYCYWTRLIGSFFFFFCKNEILLEMMSPMIFLAAWFNFMLMAGETKIIGLYLDMFFSVLKHFLKILAAFSIFILGFAICFWLYFHQQTSFSSLHLAIARIIVMFIGEIDYNDLIDTYLNQNLTAPDGTSFNISPSEVPEWYLIFPLISISLFVIAMPMVLQGLLIGIVVNDITEIYGKAAARQSKRIANHLELLVTSIDSTFGFLLKTMKPFFFTKCLRNCYDSILEAHMSDKVRVEYFFGNKSQPKYLRKAYQIVKKRTNE